MRQNAAGVCVSVCRDVWTTCVCECVSERGSSQRGVMFCWCWSFEGTRDGRSNPWLLPSLWSRNAQPLHISTDLITRRHTGIQKTHTHTHTFLSLSPVVCSAAWAEAAELPSILSQRAASLLCSQNGRLTESTVAWKGGQGKSSSTAGAPASSVWSEMLRPAAVRKHRGFFFVFFGRSSWSEKEP